MGHLSRVSSHVLGLADSILTVIQHGSAPHNSYKLTLYLDPATCSDAGAVWVFCLLGITTTAFLAMLCFLFGHSGRAPVCGHSSCDVQFGQEFRSLSA